MELPGGWVISVERVGEIDFEQVVANPDPWNAYVNLSYADELVIRPRRTGERFRPLGMGGRSAKMGDVMTNRKIPSELRSLWPLVAGPEHLLWLVGHVLDERAALNPNDEQALLLQVEQR